MSLFSAHIRVEQRSFSIKQTQAVDQEEKSSNSTQMDNVRHSLEKLDLFLLFLTI